jgi:hypothetical protein
MDLYSSSAGWAGCSQSDDRRRCRTLSRALGTWHYLQRLPPECARPWQQRSSQQDSGLTLSCLVQPQSDDVRSGCYRRRLDEKLVDIAPPPVLSGLKTPNQRMACRVEVFRRVLPLRLIAAANVAAGQTHSKMDPLHSHLQTFFASIRSPWIYIPNLVEVCALCVSHLSFLSSMRKLRHVARQRQVEELRDSCLNCGS